MLLQGNRSVLSRRALGRNIVIWTNYSGLADSQLHAAFTAHMVRPLIFLLSVFDGTVRATIAEQI